MHDHLLTNVYRAIVKEFASSVDDILVTPELRGLFLARVRQEAGELPERYLLHRLVYLRKKGRLPHSRN